MVRIIGNTHQQSVISINNVLCKLCNSLNIVIGFRRKSRHEVKLNCVFTRFKGNVYRFQQIVLTYVFIYYVTKSLRSRFGGKGK